MLPCVVCVQSSSSSIGFLRYLAKAAVVACGVTFHKPLMDTINPPTKRREAINDVRTHSQSACHAKGPVASSDGGLVVGTHVILDHSQGFNRKCPGVSLLQVSVVCTQPDLPNTFVQVCHALYFMVGCGALRPVL